MDTKDILNAELSSEQNGNMLDGIINNESTSREIPGTYDESEREADEAEHERIIKDMNENSELDKAKDLISEEAEFGSDGARVFPNLNEEPKEKLYVYFRNNAESKELSNYLTNKGFSFHFQEAQRELTTIMIGQVDIEAVRGILKDKGIINSINPLEPAEILAVKLDDFIFYHDPYSYYDALIGDRENNINIITQDIRNGNISEIKSFLDNIVEESDSPEEIKEVEGLISELSNYDIKNNDLSKTAEKSDFLTVSISSKLISEPFMAKDGNEYVRVRIPNENRNDKTPWASLVIPPGYVTKDENTGRSAIKIREEGYSTLTKSEYKGNDANGKAIFSQSKSKVANRDIKNRVERSAPRNIHQLIKENKEKASILEKNRNLEVEKNRDISKRNRNTDRT